LLFDQIDQVKDVGTDDYHKEKGESKTRRDVHWDTRLLIKTIGKPATAH